VLCAFELSALAITDPSGLGGVEAMREADSPTSDGDSPATTPVRTHPGPVTAGAGD
jgi:hypothetical protein